MLDQQAVGLMSGHVTPEELQRLLAGSLDRQRVRCAVSHLLAGCERCRSTLMSGARDLWAPPDPQAELSPELDAAYSAAIQRALRGARRRIGEARTQKRQRAGVDEMLGRLSRLGTEGFLSAPRRLRGLASVEALLQRSWELRQDDPKQMLHCALLATIESGNLDSAALGEMQVEDVRCRAALELGNAYRVSDRLQEAEEALGEAAERFRKGTGDNRLKARLLDVQASLYGDQRSFDLCFAALDMMMSLYRELGESHLVGRALVTKAVHTHYAGDTVKAIDLLHEGLGLIDPEIDPRLAVSAAHNLAGLMIDCGRYREARRILWENLPHGSKHVGHLDRLKARWLEGRINSGLGKLDLAERDFRAARDGLESAGLSYTAAIAAIDLAEVQLQRNRPDEAESLALGAVRVFLSLEISREAHTAVLFLEEAAKRRMMTGTVLRHVADFLREAEGAQPARS